MSRLYFKGKSDTRKNEITTGGHETLEGSYYYGSANESKLALHVHVSYRKGDDIPFVTVTIPEEIHRADRLLTLWMGDAGFPHPTDNRRDIYSDKQ